MERLHPGVYIQEVSSGVRPIEGVSTSTSAFLGKTRRGPLDRVVLVTSFTEFERVYGGFLPDSHVAHAALQYFNNGGRRLYVGRVASATNGPAAASVSLNDRQATPVATLQISANSAGTWANDLTIVVADGSVDGAGAFRITVKRGNQVLEDLDGLTMNPEAPNFVERAVSRSPFIAATAIARNDTSVSGASPALTLPATQRAFLIDINGDGPQLVTLTGAVTNGNEIAAAIQTAVRALTPQRGAPPAAFSQFTATFANSLYTLAAGGTGRRSVRVSNASTNNAAAALKLGAANTGVEWNASTGRPATTAATGVALSGAAVTAPVTASTTGTDGGTPQDSDYTRGFELLNLAQDVNLIAVPGVGTRAVVEAGASYCALRQDCFFIGDMASSDDTKDKAQTFINALTVKNSYAAVYFPWVKALDPTGTSAAPILLPPSGYVAGAFARTDARRGVWKAPAGTETNLAGVIGLTAQISDADQDVLNPIGANVIRFFPSSGVVIWGARTLATQSDPEYRYVPVRRLATFLERSIYNGIQWAVFEPNDEDLWSSLRMNVSSFMMNMFRAGAFQGDSPSQAFFVKCDSEINPQSEINAGVVNVLIGFAPVKPAEFVILKISQKTGDSAF